MSTYAVIYEETTSGTWSAYVPDLPGCVASSKTKSGVRKLIREAIEFHIEGLTLAGQAVPEPSSSIGLVKVYRKAS